MSTKTDDITPQHAGSEAAHSAAPASPPPSGNAMTAELRLRAVDILERVADAFVALDSQWRIVYANREACRINQKSLEEFQGKVHWDEWPASVGSELECQFRRAMTEKVEAHFEHRYVSDPYDVWLEIDVYPAEDGISLFYRDISARKHAEGALRASERRFREMADAIPHIAWTTGSDGKVDYYNQRWFDYSGLTLEQTQDWGSEPVIHPDDLERAGGVWQAATTAGTVSEVEYRLRRADGQYRWHLGRSVPVRGEEGAVRWVGTATDIEDRRQAEETRRAGEMRFRALADNIAQLAWMADGRGWIFWYNQRWYDYTSTTLEEMQGWGWSKVHHPDYLGPVTQRWREHLASGQVWEDTFPLRGSDGAFRWFLSRAFPIRDEAGSITLWCGTNTDVTEQREAEAKLAAAYGREVMLNQIGQAIRAADDPDHVLETAVRELGEALGADRCYYAVYDQEADTATAGPDWRRPHLLTIAGEYPMSQFAVNRDPQYQAGRTQVVTDTSDDPACRALGLCALIRVPLVSGTAMTALSVAMSDAPRQWTEDEVSLVETVATQTQTALEAVRVRRREHAIAEQLAQALQPVSPAMIPGMELAEYYRPALEDQGVGGDFSDVFSTDKGVTFLVVGDLSGKGLAAASQVALVRNMLRFALYNGRSLAQPIATLNTTLADYELLSGFCTLFVGRYDAEARTLAYVNCGQDAGLVLRAATGQVEMLPPTGPVLGAISGAIYTEETVVLETGDVLALYTDGLTEAGPSRTALLTGDGVARLLQQQMGRQSAAEIVTELIAGVDSYAKGGVRDDQCLLIGIAQG